MNKVISFDDFVEYLGNANRELFDYVKGVHVGLYSHYVHLSATENCSISDYAERLENFEVYTAGGAFVDFDLRVHVKENSDLDYDNFDNIVAALYRENHKVVAFNKDTNDIIIAV